MTPRERKTAEKFMRGAETANQLVTMASWLLADVWGTDDPLWGIYKGMMATLWNAESRRPLVLPKAKRVQKREPVLRNCVVCGGSFTPKRSDAKYCTKGCMEKQHKETKKKRRQEAASQPFLVHFRSRRIPRVCSVDGRDAVATCLGRCLNHYLRWRDHRDPLGGGPSRRSPAA